MSDPVPPCLDEQPVFVLTSDLDWASEACLALFLEFCSRFGIVPTLFATHASPLLDQARADGRVEVGWHPNFLPGSSHGAGTDEVLSYLRDLYPGARCYRSHSYVESSRISLAMVREGMAFDSNLCLQGQAGLRPLRHWTGMVRYPVFWEDDIHWLLGGNWDFDAQAERFFTPGLKLINVHPFNFALNVPHQDWFDQHKAHTASLTSAEVDTAAWPGAGTASFLRQLVEAVQARGGRFVGLGELHDALHPGGRGQAGSGDVLAR
ncbi:MAG TPA: hypothetical protein VED40_05320 [Azospirillaceae bacterium]|nr:hypothetical protein [Azospirillaceae bacterium]